MLYAGVDAKDQRVQAAVEWIRQHFNLDENPGMQNAGLFYYYHTFAKALNALGQPEFLDAQGKHHDWKAELVQKLAALQAENGSWVNENSRWLEGDANLVSGYALMALSFCKP
jgi:squalene-hopene/tetraprenyl-beta-curcumene cyclase